MQQNEVVRMLVEWAIPFQTPGGTFPYAKKQQPNAIKERGASIDLPLPCSAGVYLQGVLFTRGSIKECLPSPAV